MFNFVATFCWYNLRSACSTNLTITIDSTWFPHHQSALFHLEVLIHHTCSGVKSRCISINHTVSELKSHFLYPKTIINIHKYHIFSCPNSIQFPITRTFSNASRLASRRPRCGWPPRRGRSRAPPGPNVVPEFSPQNEEPLLVDIWLILMVNILLMMVNING